MRSAIIDAYYHRLVVAKVGDQHSSAEWQPGVCGCEGMLVEGFAAGSPFTMVASAVIRGNAGFVIAPRVYVMAGTAGEQAEQGAGAE